MLLLVVQDWHNSLAVAVQIIAGFVGASLLLLSFGACCWMISKTGWRF